MQVQEAPQTLLIFSHEMLVIKLVFLQLPITCICNYRIIVNSEIHVIHGPNYLQKLYQTPHTKIEEMKQIWLSKLKFIGENPFYSWCFCSPMKISDPDQMISHKLNQQKNGKSQLLINKVSVQLHSQVDDTNI